MTVSKHKQGCDALGGYGHGVGPCTCGSAVSSGSGKAAQASNWDREVINTAHGLLRSALNLPDDAPRRFDYYASVIESRSLLASQAAAPTSPTLEAAVPSEDANRGPLQAIKQARAALWRHAMLPWGRDGYPSPTPGAALIYEAQAHLDGALRAAGIRPRDFALSLSAAPAANSRDADTKGHLAGFPDGRDGGLKA